MTMRTCLFLLPVAGLLLAGCQTADQNAAAGAVGGAVVGAALSSRSDRTKGALIGAATGVAASTLIGRAPSQGQCYYRDARGDRFIAAC